MVSPKSEGIIRDLLAGAGVEVNGTHPWDIQVHNTNFYDRVLRQATLGFGESYMDDWWDCEAIDVMVAKLLKADVRSKVEGDRKFLFFALKALLLNRQSSSRAYQVGEQHYDLGNDLYEAMLDKRMNYTCAYWRDAQTLDEAQEAKLELVCKKIGLKSGMRILELGCGWGSFAQYAAENYGASVLGVTVSKEQVKLGMERCKGLPVELRLQDYREVQGTYDAVISIGILEHVGYKNYRTYMRVVDRCLKEDGIAFIHTIGGNVSKQSADPWVDKYIFTNGMLPSISQIGKAIEGLFVMEDWHNIGPDYDTTLQAWYRNFETAWPDLKSNYSERFRRMWTYWLQTSMSGFRARVTQLWQIVLTRTGTPQPDCRIL